MSEDYPEAGTYVRPHTVKLQKAAIVAVATSAVNWLLGGAVLGLPPEVLAIVQTVILPILLGVFYQTFERYDLIDVEFVPEGEDDDEIRGPLI